MSGLRASIVAVNSTRVKIASAQQWMDTIRGAVGFLKDWGGMAFWGFLLLLALLACGLMVGCMLRMKRQTSAQQHMLTQAMAALEAGSSPTVRLSMMDR